MTSIAQNSAALAAGREFPFSAEHSGDHDRIYRFSGMRLPEGKAEMVYARLARRLRSLASRPRQTFASSSLNAPNGALPRAHPT